MLVSASLSLLQTKHVNLVAFFSPPGQPNETSVSLSYVQWAQQLVEARWVPAYDPELAHRANIPSAGQDSSCPTFCTMSVRYVAVVEGNAENLNEEKVLMDAKHVRFFSHWARLRSLPQRGLNLLGAGSDRYPSVDWTLGETGSCQSQPCSWSLKEQCMPSSF